MRAWQLVLLALGGLRRTPLRITLTALGVAIASAMLLSMMGFALGLQRQIETPMKLLSLLNDIRVSPKESEPAKRAAPLDDAAVERLSHLPGVAAAFPDIRVRGVKVRHGDHTESCLAVGAPREASLLGMAEEILVAGRFFRQDRQPEAILGAPLIRSLGFATPREAIGATLVLEAGGLSADQSKSFTYRQRAMQVTVVGVYELPIVVPTPAKSGLILPLDLMKDVPGINFETALAQIKAGGAATSPGYGNVTVRVRDVADVAAVEERIKNLGFETRSMLSRFNEMQTFLIFLQVLLAAVGTIALVVAALGIVNTLLMAVLERQQEIGVCKALGASDGDVTLLFLAEAGLIGLLGGLGGLVLGRAVCYGLQLLVNVYARRHGVPQHLDIFAFPFWLLAGTTLFAIFVSVLAGVLPARRAARVDPIRALRGG
jgi:putative ABC transport system permease protein